MTLVDHTDHRPAAATGAGRQDGPAGGGRGTGRGTDGRRAGGQQTGGRKAGAAGGRLAGALPGLVAALVAVGLWALAARALPAYVPGPVAVVRALAADWPVVWTNGRATLEGAAKGWLWGNACALALAALGALLPRLEGPILRVAAVVYCLPVMAIGPVLQSLLPGNGASVAIAALSVFFTTLLATALGLRSAPPAALDVVRAAGGSRLAETARVRLRSALPSMFAGLRVAAPAAMLGAILGEYLGASVGLGNAIITAQQQLDLPLTWALALFATAVSAAGYLLTGVAGRLVAPWAGEVTDILPAAPAHAGLSPPARAARAALAVAGSVLAVIALWWGSIRVFGLSTLVAKTPADVWRHMFSGEDAGEHRDELLSALGTTMWESLVGFAAGTAVAMLLVALLALWPAATAAMMPATILLQSVPLTVFTPLMLTMFGDGLTATVVIAGIIVFFPTLVTVLEAVRATPTAMIDVLRAAGGGRLSVLLRAQLPHALPALLSAARICVPRALIGALVAEWLATGRGIGYLMLRATATYQYDQLWSAVVLTTAVMIAANGLVGVLESWSLRRSRLG